MSPDAVFPNEPVLLILSKTGVFVLRIGGKIVVPCVLALLSMQGSAAESGSEYDFKRNVQPILAEFCYRCHDNKKASADLKLRELNIDLIKGPDAESWHDVLNKLNLGEMPPAKELQPTELQRQMIVNWVTTELKRAAAVKRNTGGHVVLRRLTRYEFANTMRDLLGVDLDYAADLPPEPSSADGFRNNGATLGMSPLQLEYYLKAARMGLRKAIVTGEQPFVYTHHAKESVVGRSKKIPVGNRMGPGGLFLAKMDEFPRDGEFLIQVKAGARVPEGSAHPRLTVAVGVRADVLAPKKIVGEVDVDASLDDPQVYEFRGRMEDFPLPGKNPKFPGMLITLTHVGKAPPPPKRVKGEKKKKLEPPMEDPTKPLIVVESIDFEGPVFQTWPPASHTQILFPSKLSDNEEVYAREVLQVFMERAFRRPVDELEVEQMMTLYEELRPRSASLDEAMRDVLAMVLISPDFLYLLEPRDQTAVDENGKQPLTDHELAARLSYFLWSTMPNEQLSKLAASGKLRDKTVLEKQVRRLIADERSWNFVKRFTNQWLDLSGLDRVAVNPEFYPNFDDRLKPDMRLETQHFFAEILKNDLSALNLIDSDFAMLNYPLARHYGIDGPLGTSFERVALNPEDHRGGLLTQSSILLANSTGEDSHPIRRAVWLLDRLLDDPPPPPPPDVPDLNTDQPDLAALPLKRQLEIHRTKSACMSCHQGIDPWGVPFENFDAVGLWRTEVTKPGAKKRQKVTTPIDATSTLPGGHEISGIDALKDHLLQHDRERFSRAVVTKLMAYGLGRSPELADMDTIDRLANQFAVNGYRLSDLIVAIVQSNEFLNK
ncbi:MAG: DUF1592 domain-containing protein [Pirellulaceae bacterium]